MPCSRRRYTPYTGKYPNSLHTRGLGKVYLTACVACVAPKKTTAHLPLPINVNKEAKLPPSDPNPRCKHGSVAGYCTACIAEQLPNIDGVSLVHLHPDGRIEVLSMANSSAQPKQGGD
jgi:hypothetical protein